MARPAKTIRRDRQLNFSLTGPELEALQARADQVAMRLVDYGRDLLLNRRASRRRAAAAPEATARPLSKLERLNNIELRRIGNNLNQLVHWHHRYSQPAPQLLEPLLHAIRQLIDEAGP